MIQETAVGVAEMQGFKFPPLPPAPQTINTADFKCDW